MHRQRGTKKSTRAVGAGKPAVRQPPQRIPRTTASRAQVTTCPAVHWDALVNGVRCTGLVDSGAECCAMRLDVARQIGLEIRTGGAVATGAFGEKCQTGVAPVTIQVGRTRVELNLAVIEKLALLKYRPPVRVT